MINRYSREEMANIWTEESKFNAWLKVELLSCEALNLLSIIPNEDLKKLYTNSKFNIDRIYEIEQETKHDVVAFTRSISENLGEEKKWIHYGLTSTDVIDTAYGYLYKKANDILEVGIKNIIDVLKENAHKYKYSYCIGRTHGIHAEITTFGFKMAVWYEEMGRNLERFMNSRQYVEAGKISGSVGTFANIPPFVQDYVCEKLQINSSKISTQVLQRDRHADYFATLALIASTIEKMGVEIRHLQRTEVFEVEEFFSQGQKGSSSMPHKRNPISSENMAGCARLIRGYMVSSYENIALWHERDISHSSCERVISGDATILLDYMLNRFCGILKNLVVYEENMLNNIEKTYGVIYSQRFMLKLIEKGISREKAYDIVQPNAMKAYNERVHFKDIMLSIKEVKELFSSEEFEQCFNPKYHVKHIDDIFNRVFK